MLQNLDRISSKLKRISIIFDVISLTIKNGLYIYNIYMVQEIKEL